MEPLKILAFPTVALGAFLLFWYARDKPWEHTILLRSLFAITIFKFVMCVAVYAFWPSLIQYSDSRNFYFPQTELLLSGAIPYRDFDTPYSPFFFALLAPLVAMWRSPGAVVLTMLLLETATLWLYLRRSRNDVPLRAARSSFLYAFSPLSLYWVALSGHNGVVIGFFTMASLILAERYRFVWSGVAAAGALLCCKLLGVLSWPGIVLFERRGRMRRLWPVLATPLVLVALMAIDASPLHSFRQEFGSETTGNLWFFVSVLARGSIESSVLPYLPVVAFAIVYVPLCVAFARKKNEPARRFDAATAFVAGTYLLFMVLSRKAFSFYIIMGLLPVIHTLLGTKRPLRHLVPLLYIASVSWLEETHSTSDLRVVVIEALRIVSYAYLAVICFRATAPGAITSVATASGSLSSALRASCR